MHKLHSIWVSIAGAATSVLGTVMSWTSIQAIAGTLAGLGSVVVSIATVWWIRKQAKALDRRQEERDQGK